MADKIHPKMFIILESQSEPMECTDIIDIGRGHIQFKACVQTTDIINRNKNKYAKNVIAEAYKSERLTDLVKRHAWFGEQSHPWDKVNFNRCVDILPDSITHRICNIPSIVGNKCMTIVRTVEPKGNMLASWIRDEKTQIGFSMRGLTPVTQEVLTPYKHNVVYSPVTVLTYDAVFFPSHNDALMEGNANVEDPCISAGATANESVSIYNFKDIADYITEESSVWNFFRHELGVDIDHTCKIEKVGKTCVGVTLSDGRAAAIRLEAGILHEIGKFL